PPRPPVNLPLTGNLKLPLLLGPRLGTGSSGLIFEAQIDPDGTSPCLLSTLPPLAAKVSYRGRRAASAHEAYYYDTLQPLQGISIARFYGHFLAELPSDISLLYSPEGYEDDPVDSDIEEIAETSDSVSILVMERLGDLLPVGEPLSDSLKQDAYDIYDDLAHMHIWPRDVRYANILSAPPSVPGLPSVICPIHNRAHTWRVVDFEHAVETNVSLEAHAMWAKGYLLNILIYLPRGYWIDPEDCGLYIDFT
ncbi:uncharacterized protein PHACADRAFT_91214, partial [Phanerochaete carnosa HHB-10118-sp]